MKSDVFNGLVGSTEVLAYPTLTKEQERNAIADLFEQLMIFDRITIRTSRLNFSLAFLIYKLGINTVERLLEAGYIKFMLWTPVIFLRTGREREDKTVDESVIYGQPPLTAATLGPEDLDPERNIKYALSRFDLHSDRERSFIKKALRRYIVPNGMEFSSGCADLVVDAYKNNNLADLGLPYVKEPEQLNLQERGRLLELGHKVMETAVLSQYGLKSYENYEHIAICKKNLNNIGKAYNVSDNTSVLLKLENLPDLKQLFLTGKLDFDAVFKLKHLSNAKYFRRWINEVGESSNAQEITTEYLKEIKGHHKFIDSAGGKLIKSLMSFGISSTVGAALAGIPGAVAGLALGQLETFWVDSILKGKNPSMFIDDLKENIDGPELDGTQYYIKS